jgi:hypothetical protein
MIARSGKEPIAVSAGFGRNALAARSGAGGALFRVVK